MPHAAQRNGPLQPEEADAVRLTGGTRESDVAPDQSGRAGLEAQMLHMQQTLGNRAVQRFVQRSTTGVQRSIEVPTDEEIRSSSGGGTPLGPELRAWLEPSIQADLSGVRLHTDDHADHLAQSLGATAFTTGKDIFFSAGAFAPGTRDGDHVLAHEAAHVAQQAAGPVAGTPTGGGLSISNPTDQFEQAADRTAEAAVQRATRGTDASSDTHVSAAMAPLHGDPAPVQRLPLAVQRDEPSGTTPQGAPAGQTAPPGAGDTVNTLWNINFNDQFAGTGSKIEPRKDTTALYVKELKIAPSGDAGATPPAPKLFSGVTLARTGKAEMGAYAHPKSKGGKVSASIAYGNTPTFDFAIRTVDYDAKTADQEEKDEAANVKAAAVKNSAAHKAIVKELTDKLDTFVDEAEAQKALDDIVSAHFQNVDVAATVKIVEAKQTTPVNTTDLIYDPLSSDRTFDLFVKIPNVTKDKSYSSTTGTGGEVTSGNEASKELTKEQGTETKTAAETAFIQSVEAAFLKEVTTVAEKVRTTADVSKNTTTHSSSLSVQNATSAKLTGSVKGHADLDLSGLNKIPLVGKYAGKLLGSLLKAGVDIDLTPDLSDTFTVTHESNDEESREIVKSEETKVRNEIANKLQESVKNAWTLSMKRSLEQSTHEVSKESTGEKKSEGAKKTESKSSTVTSGTVTIVANAVQPQLTLE